MITLHVDLQVGFQKDRVVVKIDGETVFQAKEVTTSLLEGVADSFQVEIQPGMQEITVKLPGRDFESTFSIFLDREQYLGIDLEEGRVVHRLSDEPFGYA